MTRTSFIVTAADYLDIFVFLMVVWVWKKIDSYENSDVKEELFGPEEDSKPTIRFVGNVIYDIIHNIFHLDYLMAAITAVLWIRCNMMLRSTEFFGPLLVMIWKMAKLVL